MLGQFSQSDLKTTTGLERVLRNISDDLQKRVPLNPSGIAGLDLSQLIRALAPGIRDQLQSPGGSPIDLTNLLPVTSSSQLTMDTHANRLVLYTPPTSAGLLFWETDRHVLYVSIDTGSLVWHFAAGLMIAVIGSRPSDLGPNDVGFLFFASDDQVLSVWDGSTWNDISSQDFPYVVDTIALTGQTADIPATMFVDSDVVGTFRCNYYIETTTANPTAGDVELEVAFTDDVGATTVNSALLPLTSTGRTSGVFFIQVTNTAGITYATTITGAASGSAPLVTRGYLFGSRFIVTGGYMAGGSGAAEYALYLSLERLS